MLKSVAAAANRIFLFVCLAKLGVAAATDVRKLSETQDADQNSQVQNGLMLEKRKIHKKMRLFLGGVISRYILSLSSDT